MGSKMGECENIIWWVKQKNLTQVYSTWIPVFYHPFMSLGESEQ